MKDYDKRLQKLEDAKEQKDKPALNGMGVFYDVVHGVHSKDNDLYELYKPKPYNTKR